MSLMIASLFDRWFLVRQGTGSCACGAVRLKFTVPGSSYGLVEQSTALCHCKDCVGFVSALGVNGQNYLTNSNNATQMVNFYQSDVQVVQGVEHVGMLKLTSGSLCIRCYCRVCGTPLGLQGAHTLPIVGIYTFLLTNYSVVFLPGLVLNFASAIPGTRAYAWTVTVRRGMMAPGFILRTIGRVLVGIFFGKFGDGLLPPKTNTTDIPVGTESIVISKTAQQ